MFLCNVDAKVVGEAKQLALWGGLGGRDHGVMEHNRKGVNKQHVGCGGPNKTGESTGSRTHTKEGIIEHPQMSR